TLRSPTTRSSSTSARACGCQKSTARSACPYRAPSSRRYWPSRNSLLNLGRTRRALAGSDSVRDRCGSSHRRGLRTEGVDGVGGDEQRVVRHCGYVLAFGRMLAKSPVSEWFRHSSSAHPVMDNGSYPRKSVPPFRYGVVHLALRCVMYIRCWA